MKKFIALIVGLLAAVAVASAATVDLTKGGYGGLPNKDASKLYVLSATIDFSDTARNASDVHQVIKVPEGVLIFDVNAEVVTATTNDITANIGDSSSTSNYFAAVALTNVVNAIAGATPALAASNDTINVILSGDSGDTGKVVVRAILMDTLD